MRAIEVALTVQDVRESVAVARSHGEKFFEQIIWQIENEVWNVLGHESWDSMRAAEYGDMGVVVPRADRPELVSRMRAKGLTQAEVASTLGVTNATVSRDEASFANVNEETKVNSRGQDRPATYKRTETTKEEFTEEIDGMNVDLRTGEIVDTPRTGLDGKSYTQKPREPQPVIVGNEANLDNARRASTAMGSSLETLYGLSFTGTRNRILTDWWPLGKDRVPPAQTELFTPSKLRQIAQGLIETANELEALNV